VELTLRDVLYALGLLFMGVGVYVAVVQRLTRLEALVDRIERVEQRVDDLEEEGREAGKQLAGMRSELTALGKRVDDGIAAVLAAVRSLRGDRRGGSPA
jgi:hypothetical protein